MDLKNKEAFLSNSENFRGQSSHGKWRLDRCHLGIKGSVTPEDQRAWEHHLTQSPHFTMRYPMVNSHGFKSNQNYAHLMKCSHFYAKIK